MNWYMDMSIIFLVGLVNMAASIFCGLYWLKYERFPWEKKEEDLLHEEETQSYSDQKEVSYK